jgi:hypothetical protein
LSTTPGGNLLEAKALLKIFASSSDKPPIPISDILKSGLNKLIVWSGAFKVLSFSPYLITKDIYVCSITLPTEDCSKSFAPTCINSALTTVAERRYF